MDASFITNIFQYYTAVVPMLILIVGALISPAVYMATKKTSVSTAVSCVILLISMILNLIMLTADNDFIKKWVERQYSTLINQALVDLYHTEFIVNIEVDELGAALGEALLVPTRIYVKPVLAALAVSDVRGVSHITGGGFYENVPHMLRDGVRARIHKDSYPVPPVFRLMAERGEVEEKVMYNTFNMGIGMVLAVRPEDVKTAMKAVKEAGEYPYQIGRIIAGEKGVELC